MALFPRGITPVSAQKHLLLRCIAVVSLTIISLVFVIIALWPRHEVETKQIDEKYYIKAQQEESWIEKFAGDPVALFTLILTGATVGLYLATRSLFVATEKLVIGADKASERQLRAYVGLETTEIVRSDDIHGMPTRLETTIRNFGNTPAVRYQISINWLDVATAEERSADSLPRRNNPSTLMPGATDKIFILPNTFSPNNATIVYGQIAYEDVFGANHFTDFRLRSALGTDDFVRDTRGNESD